jgi:hypothetical protein
LQTQVPATLLQLNLCPDLPQGQRLALGYAPQNRFEVADETRYARFLGRTLWLLLMISSTPRSSVHVGHIAPGIERRSVHGMICLPACQLTSVEGCVHVEMLGKSNKYTDMIHPSIHSTTAYYRRMHHAIPCLLTTHVFLWLTGLVIPLAASPVHSGQRSKQTPLSL